ncbi:MAG TPA: MFS transporter [Desulfotomaculum sp.]|nr:MAG: Drug resistance transporter, EmrB/QacA subfamily [Parcubacteria bacterium 33_209]HAU32545.1 MFS transporter [Desulfotomaculum sp.]
MSETKRITSSEEINWSVVTVVIVGTFMAILDSSIVNVALPKMMVIFSVSEDSIQWVLTVYMLTLGVIMPLSGFLGDTFGYKRVYFFALALFVIGSAFCGMSWSVNSMIGARIFQAVGGGILQPIGMAILYNECPRSKMGMVLGVWGISAMAAPAIGPTLGGYLVEYVNWRMIFYLNLPIGIINLFLVTTSLKETKLVKGKRLDAPGIVLSTAGFFCLLLALSNGAKDGWNSPYIVTLLCVSGFSLFAFVLNELLHPEPLLDLKLFGNFTFSIANIIGSILSIGMFGAIFLIPMLLQNFLGQTALKTGLITFPSAVASGLMMPISGRIFDKYGAKAVTIVGLVIVSLTTYILGGINALTPFAMITFWLTIRGAGMGLSLMPISVAAMNTVPKHLVGKASALMNVIRQISASFGIAMFTTIMQSRGSFHFSNMAESVNMRTDIYYSMQAALRHIASTLTISPQALGIGLVSKQLVVLSMIKAINDCFIIASCMCLAALFLCFLVKGGKKAAQPDLKIKKAKHVAFEG